MKRGDDPIEQDGEKSRGVGAEGLGESSEEGTEEDFMSDSFLTGAEKAQGSAVETYGEKRRKEVNAGRERGKVQSRVEREKEARAFGLSKSLLEGEKKGSGERGRRETESKRGREGEDGDRAVSQNKAMKMMLAMGYQHGKALGKQEEEESGKERGASTDDLAAAPPNGKPTPAITRPSLPPPPSTRPLTEPLALDERWLGPKSRAGIGRLSLLSAQALSRDISNASTREQGGEDGLSAADHFRRRARDEHEVRQSERLLVDARSTCEDLDRKLGVEYSPLWINPEALSKQSDQLPEHVAALIQHAFAGLEENAVGEENGEEEVARAKEAKQFCLLKAKARLEITLSHLRRAHCYCLFCGHRYKSEKELQSECPGEEEDDH